MSTSVYNSERFSMGCRPAWRSRTAPEKVKRALFSPVDHESNRVFIEKHLNLEYSRGCQKWNFNFREEVPLDADGDYVWTPRSPAPTRKRKAAELPDNSAAYYFQPIEGGAAPAHRLEPHKPLARAPDQPKGRMPKQSLITDYMLKSKRPVLCSKDTDERPNKIPKLGGYRSS